MNHVREITDRFGKLLAMIVGRSYDIPGISFFTPPELGQQVAHIKHPAGKVIDAHIHLPARRVVNQTIEVLYIQSGKLQVDIYDTSRVLVVQAVVGADDVVILIDGGHGFTVLEDCEFYEVKTGPYLGADDKERFTPGEVIPTPTPEKGLRELAEAAIPKTMWNHAGPAQPLEFGGQSKP